MASEYLFAVGTIGLSKLKAKPCSLLGAARHNRRAIRAEDGFNSRIDPDRSALNETLQGPSTPEEIVALAESLMAGAGVEKSELRKDYTQAIELLFSLPPTSSIDDGQYFRCCTEWAAKRCGAGNILSSDIHRDESAPHCHVLILPLVSGKMSGGSLVDRKATALMCTAFFQEVASEFGLKRPTARIKGDALANAARAVLKALEDRQDPILISPLWNTVRRDVEADPRRFGAALGLDFEVQADKRLRTMAQIFTSKGKGGPVERREASADRPVAPTPIGFKTEAQNPIGIETSEVSDVREQRTLPSVGFGRKSDVSATSSGCCYQAPTSAASLARTDSLDGLAGDTNDRHHRGDLADHDAIEATRERDGDHESGHWSEELGEFIQAPVLASRPGSGAVGLRAVRA